MMKHILLIILLVIAAGAFFAFHSSSLEQEVALSPELVAINKEHSESTTTPETPDIAKIKKEIDSLAKSIKTLTPLLPPLPLLPPAVKSSDIYAKALKAAVNIFCYDQIAHIYIMGSGAVIHPLGYVLTNGHLAVHFNATNTDCVLRRGSPARDFAKAKVVWLPDQTSKIGSSEIPKNDVAILKITNTDNFEYFKLEPDYRIKDGETLYSLNYPSEFLGADTALRNTNLVFSLGTVDTAVTIDDNTSNAEGVYLKGELSVQHGSSGGIFLDAQNGEVVGLFVGLTEGKTTADRKQFMFMTSYIDRIMREEKGIGLGKFLDSNP